MYAVLHFKGAAWIQDEWALLVPTRLPREQRNFFNGGLDSFVLVMF
jgi:hypothetical protein